MKTFFLILMDSAQSMVRSDGSCQKFTVTARSRTRAQRLAEKAAGPGWEVALCEEFA